MPNEYVTLAKVKDAPRDLESKGAPRKQEVGEFISKGI